MLIVTSMGEAINAHHMVRFCIQPEAMAGSSQADPTRFRLMLQLTSRQRIVGADGLELQTAQTLLRDVVRAWTRGQSCLEIAGCLDRIQKGEAKPAGLWGTCL